MYYFIGWPFVTDGAGVTSAGSTNPAYLTNWFTAQRIVTASGTSATIILDLGATAQPVDYVCLYNVSVPASSLSPTWRAQVYDDQAAVGTELLDSGVISAVSSFAVQSTLDTPITDPAQLVYRWTVKEAGGRSIPAGTVLAKSIKFTLATSSAATWSIGYVAAGKLVALSEVADVGAAFAPSSSAASRPVSTTGGGVTHSQAVNTSAYPFDLPNLSAEDKATIQGLYSQVGDSAPFFAYPSDTPASRDQQLGIVRFADSSLRFTKKDTLLSAAGRYSLSTSVQSWR